MSALRCCSPICLIWAAILQCGGRGGVTDAAMIPESSVSHRIGILGEYSVPH